MPHRLKPLLTALFQNWGFASLQDYVLTVVGLKGWDYVGMVLKVLGAVLAGGFVFMANWIWEPPGAALLIICMNLLNARYGYLVARKIKGEKFSRVKFQKTLAICASDLLLMSMIHHAIQFYPYYSPLGHLLFGWLFTNRTGAILNHMADLKLQDGGFKRLVIKWMLDRMKSFTTAQIVDKIQDREEDNPKEDEIL